MPRKHSLLVNSVFLPLADCFESLTDAWQMTGIENRIL
jgi:hypothetical protein